MQKFNIAKPEKYIGKDGVEKTYWNTVGTYIEFPKQDGTISRVVEIHAIGLKAQVFPIKPKEEDTQQSRNEPTVQVDDDQSIPF
jgi:hypothetical protein